MAGENQLKDAKISVRLDTTDAERALDELARRGKDAQKGGEERKQQDEKRKEKKQKTNVGVIPRARSALGAAVKAFLLIQTLKIVSDVVAGAIEEATSKVFGEFSPITALVEKTVDLSLRAAVDRIQALESVVPAALGAVGSGIDFARSQALLGTGADASDVAELARIQFQIGFAERRISGIRSSLGREALGKAAIQSMFSEFGVNK